MFSSSLSCNCEQLETHVKFVYKSAIIFAERTCCFSTILFVNTRKRAVRVHFSCVNNRGESLNLYLFITWTASHDTSLRIWPACINVGVPLVILSCQGLVKCRKFYWIFPTLFEANIKPACMCRSTQMMIHHSCWYQSKFSGWDRVQLRPRLEC